jgi:thioredoxin-dependent peroxiredoxin
MALTKFKGNDVSTVGDIANVGDTVKDFTLVAGDLSEKSLKDFAGKRKVLNIVPSLDTGVCAASARKFNVEATNLENTVVLTISADLPFAQSRFCEVEGINNVVTLSTFRSSFADDYGVKLAGSPLAGLAARVVLVLNESNTVIYKEVVPEITTEPNYEAALNSLK